MGVTYVIGCEPAILPYKDFSWHLTIGRWAIRGAKEELSIQKFEKLVNAEVQKAIAAGGTVDKQKISQTIYNQLVNTGATSTHLLLNNATLEGTTDAAKQIASATSMAEVRLHFHMATAKPYTYPTYVPGHAALYPTYAPGHAYPSGTFTPRSTLGPIYTYPPGYTGKTFLPTFAPHITPGPGYTYSPGALTGSGGSGTGTGALIGSEGSGSGTGDTYSAVHSGISIDQVDRLVQKAFG
ncbi:Hypothetical predicted protein [Mytilus galloprovincialis]|uniref:Uncharacterized protein n=1 Tax=Mytilus galloprovincialis TaxID=29158 RepID=A0A8B6DAM7_MYTGA|nr:Hypothetical predicted protein [Mytilus galloprovincialis]